MHPDAEIKTTPFNVCDQYQHLPVEQLKALADTKRLPYAVALANITGDLNTGVIIRSACCLGAEKVFTFGRRKYDRRSTVGAHHYIDVIPFTSADEDNDTFDWAFVLHTIRTEGYTPVILEQGGKPLWSMFPSELPGPLCLIFGPENGGIPPEYCQGELWYTIPQPGIVRSLNVSSAASIAMWHTMCGLMGHVEE